LFRHLLLHTARRWGWCSLRSRDFCWEIGGANIENPPPSSSLAEEERLCSLLFTLLAPLAAFRTLTAASFVVTRRR
jgi:hypothetical protein